MKLSVRAYDRLKKQLIAHEGFRQFPYEDTEGILTIGIGRNLVTRGIAMDEALTMLRSDIISAWDDLERTFPWFTALDENRQIALLDMCVNLGIVRLERFAKTMDAIKKEDWNGAAKEMLDSKWAEQVGQRAVMLAQIMRTGRHPEEKK